MSNVYVMCVGMASDLAVSVGATVTLSTQYSTTTHFPKLAIDGNLASDGRLCAATQKATNQWLRIELKNEYFVSSVGVILPTGRTTNVNVRVGSDLTDNGNANHNCGTVPGANSLNWRNVSCNPAVWGKYINLQRNDILHVCEVVFSYG